VATVLGIVLLANAGARPSLFAGRFSAMSDTLDGSDCAVIEAKIAVSFPRRNGAGISSLPLWFHVADGGPTPVLKQGILDEYVGPSAAERFNNNSSFNRTS
jgi:hypothetical protein